MARILHITDLHLVPGRSEQETILSALVGALEAERSARGAFDLVCLTGDVFESGSQRPEVAVPAFCALFDAMQTALGGDVPTIIVPGNHDRRRSGVFLPHDARLFLALRDALGARAFVHGCEPHFLGAVVPNEVHRLPMWIVAYDSNHVPDGVFGAGGVLREEDILRAASIIDGHRPDWPVLFLLHHHMIPTPLTDLGPVDSEGASAPVRWLLERALPRVLANADREELFMTALGAGTALSILHSMNRAVLVLHGHKHYASARLLTGTQHRHGDVLIVSGGSAGTAQPWTRSPHRDTARLWPSFNVIELDGSRVAVDTVAFKWRASKRRAIARRPMVRGERRGGRWHIGDVVPITPREPGPRLVSNTARIDLVPSRAHGHRRWDCEVTRAICFHEGRAAKRYVETVDGPPGATLIGPHRAVAPELPAQIVLDPSARTRYALHGGVARTIAEEARIARRDATPYGRVGLMNRYPCDRARLVVTGLGERAATAFGSATDLGTGLSRPVAVEADSIADRVVLEVEDCPPRTLLRVYWLLEDRDVPVSAGIVPSHAPIERGSSSLASSERPRHRMGH